MTTEGFKTGEYVVYLNGTYRIENDGKHYILFSVNENTSTPVVHVQYGSSRLRLWTVHDAKDGDVLSYNDGHGNDCIELIKSITDKKIEFWFCLTNGNRYEVFDGIIPYTNLVSREDATPATKEQRDLLFQKMKEAGYEWDPHTKKIIEVTMATIDYKEKYMQALERARQFSEKPYLEDSAGIVEYIFPELSESKNDKIRKALVKYFTSSITNPDYEICGIPFKEVLAWLEKQGKKDEEILILKDQIESLHAARKAQEIVHKIELEKQGRQNLAEWSEEDKSYLLDFTRWFEQKAKAYDINLPMRGFDICAFCKEIIERLRICENLVWENIDETQRTNAIIMLKEGARRVYSKDSIDKCVDWLKSLKDRAHLQSKQEWSEEDKELLDYVCSILTDNFNENDKFDLEKPCIGALVDWLKSLRPQSQWKPSDMELEVLRLAAEKDGTCLMGLYEQLKKLREE